MSAAMTGRTIVIGAGLSGLSAALHLAGAGREVTVLEQRDGPGGLMGRWQADGYTFDTGPSVLTLPELIDDALAAVGETRSDWLPLQRLEPAYTAHYADGSTLHSYSDPDRMAAEIARVCGPDEAAGYRRLAEYLSALYRLEFDQFMARNLDSVRDLISLDGLRLLGRGGLGRLDRAVGRYLHDDRTQRLFTFQALYAGVSPARARALYGVISYLDSIAGVWFPVGGMAAVAQALAGAAARHGVEFRYAERVNSIETAGDRAIAVHTATGDRIPANAVVFTGDLAAGQQLLPPRLHTRRRYRYSPSALVWLVGSSGTLPEPAHHTISFGQAWARSFTELIDEGRLMSDPSVLITEASHTDPELAPPGRHSYFVLVPVPNQRAGPIDWARIGPHYLDEVIATLDRRGLGGPFTSGIETSRLITPLDWAGLGLAAGTPFALAHTLSQTGPLRPSTAQPGLTNLVRCGAGVQPGVGVPTVLLSGRLAAERLLGRSRLGR